MSVGYKDDGRNNRIRNAAVIGMLATLALSACGKANAYPGSTAPAPRPSAAESVNPTKSPTQTPEATASGVSIDRMNKMEVQDFTNLNVKDRVRWAISEVASPDELAAAAQEWKSAGSITEDIVAPSATNTPLQAFDVNNFAVRFAAYGIQTEDHLSIDKEKALKYVSALYDDTEYANESMINQMDFVNGLEGPTPINLGQSAINEGKRVNKSTVEIGVSEDGNTSIQTYRFIATKDGGMWVFAGSKPQ